MAASTETAKQPRKKAAAKTVTTEKRPLISSQNLTPFGQVVRKLRETAQERGVVEQGQHLSQSMVARTAGMSPGYVGLIETGERGEKPGLEMVKKLAAGLRASPEEFEELMRAGGHLGLHESLIDGKRPTVEGIIEGDPRLTQQQKIVLISVYKAFVPD